MTKVSSANPGRISTYYQLTKPGIIYGNTMTAVAGFLLASKGHIDLWLGLATVVGVALIIASGCVFNNYIDRGIDRKMERTKNRALASGRVSGRAALTYATCLGLAGFTVLTLWVSWLTVALGAFALFSYVVAYGFTKRRTIYGTVVGTIPGSMSLVAGYASVTGGLGVGAALLFLIMAVWQLPHFFAIATYRLKDYRAAGLPVLSVVKGVRVATLCIIACVALYVPVVLSLTIFGFTGLTYAVVMGLMGLAWLRLALQGITTPDADKWAGKVFGFSLLVLLSFSAMISVDVLLP